MDWTLITNFAAAMLAVVNPLGNLPIFVSYTAGERKSVQSWLALFVAATVLVSLLLFLSTGQAILAFFGISLAAFQIAGGILLLLTGTNMIQGQQTRVIKEIAVQAYTSDLKVAGSEYRKILIPLGIPLFVGPGAISTVILYAHESPNIQTFFGLISVVFAVSSSVLVVLLLGRRLERVAGKTGLDIATRILGLLLTAIGVQFMLNGIAGATIHLINPQITSSG